MLFRSNMVLHFVDRGLAAGKGTVYDVLANDDPGADYRQFHYVAYRQCLMWQCGMLK